MISRATTLPASAEWVLALLGLVLLFVPTYVDLARGPWASESQAHGPIIFSVALFFFWQKRKQIDWLPPVTAPIGWPILIFGLLLYILGRSQDIPFVEVGSQIPVLAGVLLIMRGWAAIRVMWFPILFLIFMVPLPASIIDALTLPMKIAVSWMAEHVLYELGYPISRSGVILQIGPYKLLVADACAGLQTLFALEALGLLYLHVIRHESWMRNALMAIAIVPISFASNTTRVMVLSLITYHYGDAAGQGFLHGFAGMVLFVTALLLLIGVDSTLQYFVRQRAQARA